ncbi:MAG: hypothetical protein H8D47_01055 [Planctomycetes bacterium]|nr:hypothetical protein [Planctomycetota bacterium]MBL7106678.1 hypothetical protein [Phycisphaerae bacterium]
MNIRKVLYLLLIVVGGCVPSLHPLYTEKDIIFEEKLLGTWKSDDPDWVWEFEKGDEENSYDLFITEEPGEEQKKDKLIVHLVRLDDMLFLDFYPEGTLGEKGDIWLMHLVPAHTFMKVEQIDSIFKARFMNPDEIANMLEDKPDLIRHEVIKDDKIVLTASTLELQNFIKEHAEDEDFFLESGEFKRVIVTEANEPDEDKQRN